MSFEKTGGPAFPATIGPGGSEVQVAAGQWAFPGITARDYFAARFMEKAPAYVMEGNSWNTDKAAELCYEMADSMMKARDA